MKKATNTTKSKKQVAERLYEARINLGISQERTAKLAQVDRKTVNRIENGHFSPSLDTFFRLCQVLKVKPEALVKGLK
ncbi:MAG: XRE family transcriptional regulator [Actinobacteria bacterium]|nr:XRE family transcriptional regulator [Actinomycetota bacterium]